MPEINNDDFDSGDLNLLHLLLSTYIEDCKENFYEAKSSAIKRGCQNDVNVGISLIRKVERKMKAIKMRFDPYP